MITNSTLNKPKYWSLIFYLIPLFIIQSPRPSLSGSDYLYSKQNAGMPEQQQRNLFLTDVVFTAVKP